MAMPFVKKRHDWIEICTIQQYSVGGMLRKLQHKGGGVTKSNMVDDDEISHHQHRQSTQKATWWTRMLFFHHKHRTKNESIMSDLVVIGRVFTTIELDL